MRRILLSLLLGITATPSLTAAVIRPADRARATSLVSQMTLEEKCLLITGQVDGFHTAAISRLGIPSVRMADGPQGVRNDTRSTYYPCGMAVASSWNRQIAREVGRGIGQDALERGVGIMLCPGVNIYRSALCGRNFEYMGEDPFLAGETASNYIQGIQDNGVIATIKHFAANNQEYQRHQVGSVVDERTLNEIYFPVFRKSVEKAGVGAVMTSYNPVNGTHSSASKFLIRENLRTWGHEGIVMSDWTSTYSTIECLESGLDFEMPDAKVWTPEKIKRLIDNGVITENLLDEKCLHILQTFSAFGLLDHPMTDQNIRPVNEDSRRKAMQAALEAPVLLKNEGVLPVLKGKIALVGPNSDRIPYGGGSGEMFPIEGTTTTLYQGLSALGKKYMVFLANPDTDGKAIRSADVVIVAVGFDKDTERETADRTYALPESPVNQNELILKVCALNSHVVVLVNSGGEIDTRPWLDKVQGLMMTWYLGQEGGQALARIISGAVSPSGHLPFTFWGSEEANPSFPYYHVTPNPLTVLRPGYFDGYPYTQYEEGVFIGYRGVEHFGRQPLYPFGYGLSYSTFAYDHLSVVRDGGGVKVCFRVRNTGKKAAAEVAQVYIHPEAPSCLRPDQELKGYEKIFLQPGEAAEVEIFLGEDAFMHYDAMQHGWIKDPGTYTVRVGASSLDIRLSNRIEL